MLMRRAKADYNNLQFLFAGCLCLSPSISSQFTIEVCAAAENSKKSVKLPILKV